MGSSYKGVDLFGSGPHRFFAGRTGRRVVPLSVIADDASVAGSEQFGDLEVRVSVRGRLVASSGSGLWSLVDAIVSRAGDADSGVLDDGAGRLWAGVKLLTFEPIGSVERGREVSLAYEAVFGALAGG